MNKIAYQNSPKTHIFKIEEDFCFCPPPKITIIQGFNGSGKSTLLRYIYQKTPCIYLPEELELPAEMNPIQILKIFGSKKVSKNLLDIVNKIEVQNNQFKRLSKGNKQKLRLKCILVQALAQNTKLLLLDEPFSGLDKPSKEATETAVSEISLNQKNIKIAIITHDTWEKNIGEIITIKAGEIKIQSK
jgi:ABC-2 type transport system ATP-binding protein